MKKTTLTLAALLSISSTAKAEDPDLENPYKQENESIEEYLLRNKIEPEFAYTTNWWEYPINLVGGLILDVAWHELGHYNMAILQGCENVEFHGPSIEEKRFAGVSYDCPPNRNKFERTMIPAAGMGMTTLGNIGLTTLLATDSIPDFLRSFTATTSLMMMMDRHLHLWLTAIQNYARIDIKSSNDVHKIMHINFKTQNEIDSFYGFSLALSATELFLRRNEIGYLINTAIGKKVKVPEGLDGIEPGLYQIEPTLSPIPSGFFVGAKGAF